MGDVNCVWCAKQETVAVGFAGPLCNGCTYRQCRRCGEYLACCQCAVIQCDRCGRSYGVGQSPACKDGHDYVAGYHPFISYFDIALGREVTSLADRWNGMKRTEDRNGEVENHRLEYRDKLPKGELSARRDRIEQQKRERARG